MIREELLNPITPVKRKRLGTRSEVAARMADQTKPRMIGIPGPNGGYIIQPSEDQIETHKSWCYNWRKSMGGSWYDNIQEDEIARNDSDILFQMFNVETQDELEYAIDCYGGC